MNYIVLYSFKLVIQVNFVSLHDNFQIFHTHNAEVVEMAFEILGKKVEIIDNDIWITDALYEISNEMFNLCKILCVKYIIV